MKSIQTSSTTDISKKKKKKILEVQINVLKL